MSDVCMAHYTELYALYQQLNSLVHSDPIAKSAPRKAVDSVTFSPGMG